MPDQDFYAAYTAENVAHALIRLTNGGSVTSTYQALEEAIDGNPDDVRHRSLSIALGQIQVLCAEYGYPCLAAMVVNKSGEPGEGFFKAYFDVRPKAEGRSTNDIVAQEQACCQVADWDKFLGCLAQSTDGQEEAPAC